MTRVARLLARPVTVARLARSLAAAVTPAAAHACYNYPKEVPFDDLKLLLNVGMGTGMISLSGALIALAVFVGPSLLFSVATFALLLRD